MTETTKDFFEMTVDEIRNYRGAVFNASALVRCQNGDVVPVDLCSTGLAQERRKLESLRVVRVEYGPIVTHTGIVIDRDKVTGKPCKDCPEKYVAFHPVGL